MALPWRMGLIGPGRLGKAFAGELARRGMPLAAIAGADPERTLTVARASGTHAVSLEALADLADLIVIAVPDGAIGTVAGQLATNGVWHGKIVLHTSGSLDAETLAPLRNAGAAVGTIHPMQSFSGAPQIPAGAVFGLEGDPTAVAAAQTLARHFDGIPVPISAANKPLYHAAACVAANYLVTLIDTAQKMLVTAGFDNGQALAAILPLVDGDLANIRRNGTAAALTGPIVRGDAQTVAKHIDAMREQYPAAMPLYLALAGETLNLACEAGLAEEKAEKVREALETS